jgi:hypothetical protein
VSIPLLLLAQLLAMSTTQLLVVCCWCVLPARPTPISLCLRFKFLFTSTVEAATSSAVEAAVTAGRGDSSYSSPGPLSPPSPHFCLLSPPSTCRPECRLARIQEWESMRRCGLCGRVRYLWERMQMLLGCISKCNSGWSWAPSTYIHYCWWYA